jgi:hypothetical protein
MKQKRTIKDPTFDYYKRGGSVTKRLEGKGDLAEKEQLLKLADLEKERYEFETDLIQTLKQKHMEETEGKQSFSEWLRSKSDDYLRRLSMNKGGKVIDFLSYAKMKRPKVKELNLSSLFEDQAKTISSLTDAERDAVNDLLRRTFSNIKDK